MSLAARGALGALSVIALLVAGACSRVVETKDIAPVPALGYAKSCHSTLGSYFLPRALLQIKVEAGDKIVSDGLVATPIMVADREQTFCLDYLSLPTSEDIVTAKRDANGLLSVITSEVIDKTPEIARTLTAIGANIALQTGRGAQLTEARPGDSVELEFDPFTWRELALANKALRRFGFCLYVEDYSFPKPRRSAARLDAVAQRWCERPWHYRRPEVSLARLPVPSEVMKTGVLYRPNATHKIVILRKADPGRRGARHWKLFQTKRVQVPNVSPVLSLGVDRAAFTSRKTTLKFNGGVLTDVQIEKGSELVGFVSIPLAVAKAVVDVPAQIVKLRIADTQNAGALLTAQSQLLDAIARHEEVLAGGGGGRSTVGGGRRRALIRNTSYSTGLLIGGCRDAGGGPACDNLPNVRR